MLSGEADRLLWPRRESVAKKKIVERPNLIKPLPAPAKESQSRNYAKLATPTDIVSQFREIASPKVVTKVIHMIYLAGYKDDGLPDETPPLRASPVGTQRPSPPADF